MRMRALFLSLMLVVAWGCQPKDAAEKKDETKKVEKKADEKKAEPKTEEKKVEDKAVEAKAVEAKADEKKVEDKAVEVKADEKKVEDKAVEVKADEKKVEAKVADNASGKKVLFQFYVMSQCPFGVQVMNGIAPVLEKYGSYIDFQMDFIGQIAGDTLTSMHGENEVAGDKIELCAMKYMAENYAYMPLFECINKEYRKLPANWEGCADEAKVAPEVKAKIKACFEGDEGTTLLKASFEKAEKDGARGSPTMFLAGKPYRGGRAEADFMRGICGEFGDATPAWCGEIPKPIEVKAIVIADKRCTDRSCDTGRLEGSLKSMFPGLSLRKLDWADEEAKKMYEAEGLDYLPVVLFDQSVEKGEGYARLRRYLQDTKTGAYKSLKLGAKHDPKAEICDNKVDDTGNGKVDCADESCANQLICREEIKGKLELFAMSQCPFGVKAMNVMTEVLGAFGSDLKFEIHFIGDLANGEPSSMHGANEVAGDIVGLCAIKYIPENYSYMKLLDCYNKEYRKLPANWEACADEVAVAADVKGKIKACVDGDEGKKMLIADLPLAKSLGISASPTWVANNKFKFSGIDAQTVQKNVCQHNPDFAGCKAQLSAPEKGAPAGSCN